MWETEEDFEILDEVQGYDSEDESAEDLPYPELNPSADEDDDAFEYEDDFYYDAEHES